MADRIAQYLLGVLFLASGIFMTWFAQNEGANLPGGKLTFQVMAGFLLLVAWAILIPYGRVLALRIVGLVICAAFVWYLAVSWGTDDQEDAIKGLCVMGLPAGYFAIAYRASESLAEPASESES